MKDLYRKTLSFIGSKLSVKPVIVFESSPALTDSARVLFDGIVERKLNYRYKMIWFVEDPMSSRYDAIRTIHNLELIRIGNKNIVDKVMFHFKRDYIMATCQYYLFSNVNYSKVKPKPMQMFYYTTHGIGLKQVKDRLYPSELFSKVAVMSELSKDWLSAVYDDMENKAVNNGHPRLDLLNQDSKYLDLKFRKDNDIAPDQTLIIWVPTYRTHQSGDTNDLNTLEHESDIPLLKTTRDWEKVNQGLKENSTTLILKPHPAQDLSKVKIDNYSNIKMLGNPYLLDKDIHLYSLLNIMDAMITDYSSIGYDFMPLDRPLAFSVDDLELWSENVGFINEDILSNMPGNILKSAEDLIHFISHLSEDEYAVERRSLEKKYHDHATKSSTERTIEYLNL